MKTATRLLPAALAALLACSGNTDELKPAQCNAALGQKACGYKCVSTFDPATGCGGPSCEPCAGLFAFCASSSSDPSQQVCADASGDGCIPGTADEADCDGEGACEDLTSDELHCGACAHACAGGTTCSSGICGPDTYASTSGAARDVEWVGGPAGRPVWISDGSNGSAHDPTGRLADNLGLVTRIAAPTDRSEVAYVAGTDSTTLFGRVWEVGQSGAVELDTHFAPTIDEIAADGEFVYWTAPDATRFHYVRRIGSPPATGGFDLPGVPTALAAEGGAGAWVVVDDGAASGWRVDVLAGTPALAGTALFSSPTPLARMAIGSDTSSSPVYYVGSLASGAISAISALGTATDVWAGQGPTTGLDLFADAQGLVWTDEARDAVMEYRLLDGKVFQIGASPHPTGVTAGPDGYVYWSDLLDQAIYRVPR